MCKKPAYNFPPVAATEFSTKINIENLYLPRIVVKYNKNSNGTTLTSQPREQ